MAFFMSHTCSYHKGCVLDLIQPGLLKYHLNSMQRLCMSNYFSGKSGAERST